MNSDFATALGRALEQTRAGNPAEATRLIQAGLGGMPSLAGTAAPAATSAPMPRRRPLSQVIASLVDGGTRRAPSAPTGKTVTVPDGAQFLSRQHSGVHGARAYRLYLPATGDAPVKGLVVMLHGCTQNADDFAVGTAMNAQVERHGFAVLYPQQERGHNAMACWNWFRPGDQLAGRGEPALLAEMTHAVAAEIGVAAPHIFVAGLSAGGAMAAILGAAYPTLFAAVGVHSGLAPGAASDVAGAFAAMKGQGTAPAQPRSVPTILFHGTADQTVHPSNGEAVLRAALGPADTTITEDRPGSTGRAATRVIHHGTDGRLLAESWRIEGAGHAWSGGDAGGSYTDSAGPDASAEMLRFFRAVAQEAGQ